MRIVCGLDVHKDSIFLCIMSSTGKIFEKKYGVLTNQLEEMRDLMLTYHVQELCTTIMRSCGVLMLVQGNDIRFYRGKILNIFLISKFF